MGFETKYSDFLSGKTGYIFEDYGDALSFLNHFYEFKGYKNADPDFAVKEVMKYSLMEFPLCCENGALVISTRKERGILFSKNNPFLVELL